jgi:maleylpyruvate isomerase
VGAPGDDLLLAFRGTAAVLRRVAVLTAGGLDDLGERERSETRRRTIAGVGYSARAFAAFAEAVRLGKPVSLEALTEQRDEQVALGVSLPARALRHLTEHSAVHLRVEWRDLPADLWEHGVLEPSGGVVTPHDTLLERVREVWWALVALGGRRQDVPSRLGEDRQLAAASSRREAG